MNTELNPKLIIVSNRLPVTIHENNEKLDLKLGSGGLITALAPVLKNRGGTWIGWPGFVEESAQDDATELLTAQRKKLGFNFEPLFLTENEIKSYYDGFSNEIIWPLFHDLVSKCNFNPSYWQSAVDVNKKFANTIVSKTKTNDFLWIHDYHLMLVAQELRKMNVKNKMGFFLHIPFPTLDIFLKLPWRFQILRALLEYDLIGFQTKRDLNNFVNCIKRLLTDIKLTNKRYAHICKIGDREVRIGAFPISIDFKEFAQNETKKLIKKEKELFKELKTIFSLDRLDMSKGIPYRLEAIRYFLKNFPEFLEKVVFLQVVIPSRVDNPKYKALKETIDRLVGEINSEFTKPGWVPIQYLYRSLSHDELLTFYKESTAMLITPVKDGMNLVAKEFIASNVNEKGVLILSEFAGAAMQFQHEAILINPFDIEGVALSIYTALTLSSHEIKKRMRKMRRNVQRYDVFWWVKNFLNAAFSKDLNDFPAIDEFIPSEEEDKTIT